MTFNSKIFASKNGGQFASVLGGQLDRYLQFRQFQQNTYPPPPYFSPEFCRDERN